MHAWSTIMLFLLHIAFMLSVVKMPLKGEVGGHAFNGYGNYIVDHGKSWKNHGIVFLNFCGNPVCGPMCISVVNDAAREGIPEELRLGLVLTIYEAKGLEFDDVLLYNFFKDSQVS